MKKKNRIFTALALVIALSIFFFSQNRSATQVNNLNMNNPETLVKSFIADYYVWNQWAFERSEKLSHDEKAALSAIGVSEPIRPDQMKNVSQYVEIKTKFGEEMMKLLPQVDAEYKKIIDKYCRPNYKHLSAAWGDSLHDPKRETIVLVEIEGARATVKTKLTNEPIGKAILIDDYEYELIYENRRWYLEQVYYVTEEGRYEGL